MHEQMTKFQEIRLLLTLIQYSDKNGNVDFNDVSFSQVMVGVESNKNRVESMLYHLSEAGIIHYEEIGDDSFAPIVIYSVKVATYEYLRSLVESAESEYLDLESRITRRIRSGACLDFGTTKSN